MLLANNGFEGGWAVFTGRNDKIFHRHENRKNLGVVRLKCWIVEKLKYDDTFGLKDEAIYSNQ